MGGEYRSTNMSIVSHACTPGDEAFGQTGRSRVVRAVLHFTYYL